MRNRLEMDGLQEQIQECCDNFTTSWVTAYSLNPKELKQIQQKIQDFAVNNQDRILTLYDFAEHKGRYKKIELFTLTDIMNKYESYHDELMTFVRAATSSDWRLKDDDEAIEYIQRAVDADNTFTEELFQVNPKILLFPEAIQELDILISTITFIDKVCDNFIFLSNLDMKSEKIRQIIYLYEDSVIGFLRKIGGEIPLMISNLAAWTSSEKRLKDSSRDTFKLI